MKVDIVDNEKDYTLYADIPGVDKKDVYLKISNDGVLIIEVNQKEDNGRKFLRKERTVRKLKEVLHLMESKLMVWKHQWRMES